MNLSVINYSVNHAIARRVKVSQFCRVVVTAKRQTDNYRGRRLCGCVIYVLIVIIVFGPYTSSVLRNAPLLCVCDGNRTITGSI
jgi:hypothetical protein